MFNLTNYIEEGPLNGTSNITGSIIDTDKEMADADALTVFLAKLSVVVVLVVLALLIVMSLIFLLMTRRSPRNPETTENNRQFLEMVNLGRLEERPVQERSGGLLTLLRTPLSVLGT